MKKMLLLSLILSIAEIGLGSPSNLANVNGEAVAGAEVLSEFTRLHGGHAKFLGGEAEARKFLDRVIDRKLLIQEAYRLALQDQEDVKKAVDEFSGQKQLDYLLRTEIDEKGVPTKDEIKSAWEKNTSILYELREVLVETRDEADSVYGMILSGDDFDTVARTCSIAPSRIYGGKLPPIGWGSLDPAVESVAFSLSPGDTAPPTKTASGWEIVRLEETHSVERPELSKATLKIEGILKKRKLEERKRTYSEYLFSKFHAVESIADRSPAAVSRALAVSPNAVAATWDGGSLSLKDVFSKEDLAALASFPPSRAEAHVGQLLRQTINDALLRREAKDRKIDRVPEVADAVQHYQEELMESVLYADYVLKGVEATDAEVRADFDSHRKNWTAPERRRVAHILVKTREDAVALKKKLAEGSEFAAIAKESSLDTQTAKIGGDLGWITQKDVPPDFASVLTMKKGEISDPVQTKFGWHVIRVAEIDAPKPMAFDAAKDEVRKSLIERKRTARRAEWVAKLRAAATIKINGANVRAFAKENAVR